MLNSTIYDTLVKVNSKVELYEGSTSTLKRTCTCNEELETFTVSRVGNTTKFFGFGICKQLKFTLIDLNHDIEINKGDAVKLYFGSIADDAWDKPFPTFYVDDIDKDEKNDSITVTAYDKLYQASKHTVSELPAITDECTLRDIAYDACVVAFSLPSSYPVPMDSNLRTITFTADNPPNYGGNEDLRTILDQIAEASQTIYYIDANDIVTFEMPVRFSTPTKTITRDDYFELTIKPSVTLKSICSVTELGENIEATDSDVAEGVTQYIRENPFLNMKEPTEVATILENAISYFGGITLTQFECEWVSDYRLEVSDKLGVVAADGTVHLAYNFGTDSITYEGTFNQITGWEYSQSDSETATNSTSLGEVLNQTFAKVDKSLGEITLLASEVKQYDDRLNATESSISTLQLNSTSISASVVQMENNLGGRIDTVAGDVEQLTEQVNLAISAEDVEIIVKSEISSGVDKVVTKEKKYVFDDTGLNISDSDSPIATKVDHKGMTVSNMGEEVLVANDQGVSAVNLHATTYLHIGNTSRFEDWTDTNTGEQRTACFWMAR